MQLMLCSYVCLSTGQKLKEAKGIKQLPLSQIPFWPFRKSGLISTTTSPPFDFTAESTKLPKAGAKAWSLKSHSCSHEQN